MSIRDCSTVAHALAALSAIAVSATAEPVQTFGGGIAITDDAAGLSIDVNADGLFDLRFAYFGVSVNSVFAWDAVVNLADDEADVRFATSLDANQRSVHARFELDAIIGPTIDTGGFPFGAVAYGSLFDGTSGGPWLDMEPGFVGFSFLDTQGGRHYAWAEVELDNEDDTGFGSLILTRIAYETVAGVPIAAGDAGPVGCNPADLAEPFGTLDLADIAAFVTAFVAGDQLADLAEPFGTFDLADITAFVTGFTAGCP